MEHEGDQRRTEEVVEETGHGDPLADREPKERPDPPGEAAGGVEPSDATPEEATDPPAQGDAPDPGHVVEEKGREGDG
jgi:hypothetical protein